jgi:DNA-binding beta-propeller fold protein YncE
VNLGDFNTGVTGYYGLAGIVIDTAKEKIYVAERGTQYLHVYKWNAVNGTLEPNGVPVLDLINTMYGLALDANSNRLYVSDGTPTIRYYNTADNNSTWTPVGDFNIVVSGVPDGNRPAVAIAVDPNRGYLYTRIIENNRGRLPIF